MKMGGMCLVVFYFLVFSASHIQIKADEDTDHNMFKRSLMIRNTTDTGKCISKCFNVTLALWRRNEADPTLPCRYQQFRRNCVSKCPESEARTVVLDTLSSHNDICKNMSALLNVLNCAYNLSVDIFDKCKSQCRQDDFTDIQPNVETRMDGNGEIRLKYEGDSEMVKKALISICNYGLCDLPCRLSIINETCGKAATEAYSIAYLGQIYPIPKLYIDLGVIPEGPLECKRLLDIPSE